MINKVYEKLKKFIIKNHNFILFLILLTLILNIKTPYIIKAPGGVIPVSDSITINGKKIKYDINTSYMKVINGKVAGILASFIFPNWDLEKYEEYRGKTNLSYDELNKVEKLMMKDGNNKAITTAFNKAGINYEIKNNHLIVFYKYDEYKNNLEIGDEILECNKTKLSDINDLRDCISKSNKSVDLKINRDKKEKEINVDIYSHNESKLIGVGVLNDFEIDSEYDVKIKNSSTESGSSGGFMTTLSIYCELANIKLPKNIKIAGTGTIEEDEFIGEIDGVKYKLLGADKDKVDVYFIPKSNYNEALKVKKKYKLKLKLVSVEKLDDAINYLNNIQSK